MAELTRRNSKQRQIILDAVRAVKSHPTAEDIYHIVRQQVPNISLGTVYRNLNLLAQMGEIQKLELGCENDRFDRTCGPHAHLICSQCGKVMDLAPEIQNGAEQLVANSCKAVVTQVMVTAYGLCEQCLRGKE